MRAAGSIPQRTWLAGALSIAAVAGLVAARPGTGREPSEISVLRVGTSGRLATESGNQGDKDAIETLRSFIKDETGLNNDIERQKNWEELAAKMAKGALQVGVFQGVEFARAQVKYPELKPLAVAVNVYVYRVAYIVDRRNETGTGFAALQGRTLATPADDPGFLQLFIDRQCQLAGKKPAEFFSKILTRDNYEDALDDVVDSVVDAAAADKAALESYKRRKPGRFARLKPVAQSQEFPPSTIAYYGTHLDANIRQRFRDGLLNASNKERGQTMLTLFRLTGFQPAPADFDKVLAQARAAYPTDTTKNK